MAPTNAIRPLLQRGSYYPFPVTTTSSMLPCLSSDVPPTLYHFNDLTLDDDCELFFHLGM